MAKKDIKGSQLGESLFSDRERMELWFAANWKKCVVLTFAVILIAGAAAAWHYFAQKNDAEFREKLGAAKVEEIAGIIAEKPEHPAVPAARLRLANGLLAKGDVKGAKAEFDNLAAAAKAAVALQECGKIGSANCLELLGETQEARKSYQVLADDAANSLPTRAEAGFHAARLLIAAGNNAEAEKMLQKIADLGSNADGAQDIYVNLCRNMLKNFANIKVK